MKKQEGCPMCGAGHSGNHGGYHRDMGKPHPPASQMNIPAPRESARAKNIGPGGAPSSGGGMGKRRNVTGYKDSSLG